MVREGLEEVEAKMRAGTIIKTVVGLAVIVLLIIAGYKLVDFFISALTDNPAYEDEADYPGDDFETTVTMPPYMAEDSFYDNAESSEIHEQGTD